jgi:hypothetical protein
MHVQRGVMPKINRIEERARLVTLYAGMSDLELQKVGTNPEALTDWAFEALREEMKKRGLEWAGHDMPLPSEILRSERDQKPIDDSGNRPVILRRYRDMPEAFIERSVLEDAGIECVLQDDNTVRMDWLWSNAMGGIKLVVREKDAEEAEKILSQRPIEVDEAQNAPEEES